MSGVVVHTVELPTFNQMIENGWEMGAPMPEPTGSIISLNGPSNDPVYDQTIQSTAPDVQQVAKPNGPEAANQVTQTLDVDGHAVLMGVDNASLMPGVDDNNDPSMQIQSPPMLSLTAIGDACMSVQETLQSNEPEPQQAPMFTASMNNGPDMAVQNNWTPQVSASAPSLS